MESFLKRRPPGLIEGEQVVGNSKSRSAWVKLLGAAGLVLGVGERGVASEPPTVVKNVAVYREDGRFAGWPANHGIWSWGDEILVGFARGYYKDHGKFHHIDRERPEENLLARSKDGGWTWSVETPQPPGALTGTKAARHGTLPPGVEDEIVHELETPIDFTNPDFAFTLRMANKDNGVSRFYYSYDRGRSWKGPFRLPSFGLKGVMARPDYIVNGPHDCHVFLTGSKTNGKEGRPFAARTTDGGLSWKFLGFIGPEPPGYSIMPGTVRLSPTHLLTAIRCFEEPKETQGTTKIARSWLEAYDSDDDGRTWTFLTRAVPDAGEGNPASLLKLDDGRIVLVYGYRDEPFGMYARFSADQGKTWCEPFALRDDGGGRDLGYPRSVIRPDGKIVSVYYFHDRSGPTRYLGATIWDPGKP
jgi:hypothetical protein